MKALEEEQRNINFFQQERDRINYVWMLQKNKIEEAQAELINKEREKEDLEEIKIIITMINKIINQQPIIMMTIWMM